ncbi:DUF2125 domain-containing protein [Sulfitobacter sp. S190]|uniref:DUF2125 domain-containing protein n=1 Tax=Sulfitobacter sp. S190 TaxID=2867022 RepID=UPI0021A84EC9|nr:DUF2125 domain-containing protein [Sulfitobacter sp. S190]UWR22260.1 DUF2125 domain-containing protein [Sulfitobacter sp. S190]
MFRTRPIVSATALSLAIATPLSADVTTQQVWNNWKTGLESFGYVVEAERSSDGDTLSLDDIVLRFEGSEETASVTMSVGSMTLAARDDGTVRVTMPPQMTVRGEIVPPSGAPDDDPVSFAIDLMQADQAIIVSGDPETMEYDYSASRLEMALAELVVGADPITDDMVRASMVAEGVNSRTVASQGDMRTYDQTMQIDTVQYSLFITDTETADVPETMTINGTAGPITMASTSTVPDQPVDTAATNAFMANGFATDGTFNSTNSVAEIEVLNAQGTSKIKTETANGSLAIAVGPDGASYGLEQKDVQIGAQLAGIPFPVFLEMAKNGLNLRMPLEKREEPQNFAVGFNVTDFSMSDIIWSLFDPEAKLPRDPATIALDLTGKARLLFDLMNPEDAEQLALSGATPGELRSLNIEQLKVDAVGARLEGQGALTFDDPSKMIAPGLPEPSGEINLALEGGNGLLDTLVGMGFVPQDMAMGARMMMGLFAVPGDAPDTLSSKIEFTDDGQILANGQRIR